MTTEKTTAIEVTVLVTVEASCPRCHDRITVKDLFDEESLRTGNTTQRASYGVELIRARVEAAKVAQLWNESMCGACRIRAARKGE